MTRRHYLLAAIATPLLLAPIALPANPAPATQAAKAQPAVTVDPARIAGLPEFIDGIMAQQLATREVAGAIVTVVYKGKVLLTRGYGFADVDKRVPVDPQRTIFRPGSVSKLFTWVALMQQVERGRIDLDADVNRYIDFRIPDYEGKPIRVRDLLSHTPGMSDVGGITVDDVSKLMPYGEWMKAHIPERHWAPGIEISYSNYGAALAGYLVERVSGEPFADYSEKHIFVPLGMTSSTFREPLPVALNSHMATGYKVTDGRFEAKPFELFSNIMPAGSGSATGPDMARFMLAMLGKGKLDRATILTPKSVALLESNSFANAPRLPGMAHGFMVARESGPRMVGHGGNTGDFHSYLVLAPEADFGFFVSFTGGMGSYLARTELSDAIIGRMFPQTPAPRWTGTETQPPMGAYRGNRRDYARPANPRNDLKVSIVAPNRVVVETSAGKTAWDQIGPGLYEQATGVREGGPYDRLEFFGTPEDPRLSFATQPHVTYHFVKP
jgi:CubicO group peptidase (beta-lactamase class C family)